MSGLQIGVLTGVGGRLRRCGRVSRSSKVEQYVPGARVGSRNPGRFPVDLYRAGYGVPFSVLRRYIAMILEQAHLDVIPGQEAAFEAAFRQAKLIISAMPGFCSLRLSRCVERPSRYLLLVEWRRLEDHTEGFRHSADYLSWRALLHHFYDPFPVVEHYEGIDSVGGG